MTQPEDRDRLYRSVYALLAHADPMPMTLAREDWMAGLTVFVLVVVTACAGGASVPGRP